MIGESSRKGAFRKDIQGLRAIAVAAVVLYHFGVPGLTGGFVGVDVFFVISGFLISSHLLASLRTQGRIDFAAFYARRARRLLPASLTVAVATLFLAVILAPPLQFASIARDAIATVLYVPNILFAAQGTNYLAESAPSLFQQYWSLGVEEQFYLLWPLAIAGGYIVARRSPRKLAFIILSLTALSFIACVILTYHEQPWAFFLLPTRAWELGVGGMIAFVVLQSPKWLDHVAIQLLGWLALFALVAALFLFDEGTLFPGFGALVPVAATAAVILAGSSSRFEGLAPVLRFRPVQFVGRVSYSLYLVHWPLLLLPAYVLSTDGALGVGWRILFGAVSLPLAWVLYRFVETPRGMLSLLPRYRPRRTLAGTAIVTVLVVGCIGGTSVMSQQRPLDAGIVADAVAPSVSPVGTRFVPSNLTPSLSSSKSDVPALYGNGCHRDFTSTNPLGCTFGADSSAPRVALFGDSHAAQWFPALEELANTGQISLTTFTKSSCPSVAVGVTRDGAPYDECRIWREAVIDELVSSPPALTVLSNYAEAQLEGGNEEFAQRWRDGTRQVVAALTPSQKVVLIADTPNMKTDPAVCLSAHLDTATRCAVDRSAAFADRVLDIRASGAINIDMSDYFCSNICPAIIGDELVYRDEHHISATFSRSMSSALGETILPLVKMGRQQ